MMLIRITSVGDTYSKATEDRCRRRPLWWRRPVGSSDRQLGPEAEATFYRSMAAGDLDVQPITAEDWARIAVLVDTYADLRLGGTDASLVAIAERLGVTEIATLDLRDFRVVRPRHIDVFTLVP